MQHDIKSSNFQSSFLSLSGGHERLCQHTCKTNNSFITPPKTLNRKYLNVIDTAVLEQAPVNTVFNLSSPQSGGFLDCCLADQEISYSHATWRFVTVLHKNHIYLHFCCHPCHSCPSTYIHSINKEYRNMKICTCMYRDADKSLVRPNWKNNWKVAIFHPTRRSLLPRRPGWTDNLLNFFWVACKS